MNIADLTNPETNPLPDEVKDLVAALLEGRVHSLLILAELSDQDGEQEWIEGFTLDMDENLSDDYGFLGHLNLLQRQIQDDIEAPSLMIHIRTDNTGDDDDDDDD